MCPRDQLITFGDDPRRYPDPRVRSGSRSGSGKNCHVVNTHRTDALQKIIQQFYYAGVRRRSVLYEYFYAELYSNRQTTL